MRRWDLIAEMGGLLGFARGPGLDEATAREIYETVGREAVGAPALRCIKTPPQKTVRGRGGRTTVRLSYPHRSRCHRHQSADTQHSRAVGFIIRFCGVETVVSLSPMLP